jgi:cytochrome P450
MSSVLILLNSDQKAGISPTHIFLDQLKRMEQAHLPFGAGTRTCIRMNISILEMSKAIPTLVRRYDFNMLSRRQDYVNYWFVWLSNVHVQHKGTAMR